MSKPNLSKTIRHTNSRLFTKLNLIGLLLILTATIFFVWIRPIHQDDGWYASAAFNILHTYFGFSEYSVWNFTTSGQSGAQSGFIYRLLQLPFILIFGPSILYTKIIVFCAASLLLIGATQLGQKFSRSLKFLFPFLLLMWPGFWYHFYNRPELLAVAVGIFGIVLLTSKNKNRVQIVAAYIIPFIMFDLHPISVFWVFGVYFWHALNSIRDWRSILLGCVSGTILYLVGNLLVNGSLGVLSPLVGMSLDAGDHYIPILGPSPLNDIIAISIARFQPFFKFLGASLIWIILLVKLRSFYNFYREYFEFFIFQVIGFLILSTLFTEAVSNGYMLYSSMIFFFFIFSVAVFLIHTSEIRASYKVFLATPTALVFLYTNFNYSENYLSYFRYAKDADDRESAESYDCINHGESGYMRPTFAFQYAKYGGAYEYPLYILREMKSSGKSFAGVIFSSDADFFALDSSMERNLFIDLSAPNYYDGDNPFYVEIDTVRPSLQYFHLMIERGTLVEVCKAAEISHGTTTFYAVDKDRLAEFLEDELSISPN